MEPEPKRTKLENCSPVANVKDKRFVDLTGSPELASCLKGYVPPNTQANTQWSVKTFNSWMDWRIKAKLEARLRFGSASCSLFSRTRVHHQCRINQERQQPTLETCRQLCAD